MRKHGYISSVLLTLAAKSASYKYLFLSFCISCTAWTVDLAECDLSEIIWRKDFVTRGIGSRLMIRMKRLKIGRLSSISCEGLYSQLGERGGERKGGKKKMKRGEKRERERELKWDCCSCSLHHLPSHYCKWGYGCVFVCLRMSINNTDVRESEREEEKM